MHARKLANSGVAQLRQLLRHWPAPGRVSWEVLLLLAQRPGSNCQP